MKPTKIRASEIGQKSNHYSRATELVALDVVIRQTRKPVGMLQEALAPTAENDCSYQGGVERGAYIGRSEHPEHCHGGCGYGFEVVGGSPTVTVIASLHQTLFSVLVPNDDDGYPRIDGAIDQNVHRPLALGVPMPVPLRGRHLGRQ